MPSKPNAVVYVGPPAVADASGPMAEHLKRVALGRMAERGLTPLLPVATTVEEADALLAAHPQAALVVHPGRTPGEDPSQNPGGALQSLLYSGAVLRLGETAEADDETRPPSPPLRHQEALLVVELPRGTGPVGDETPYSQRETEGRAFAVRHGLHVAYVLADAGPAWTLGRAFVQLHPWPVTVVVHPEITAPDPDSPDGLLWRWLRQGREILWPQPSEPVRAMSAHRTDPDASSGSAGRRAGFERRRVRGSSRDGSDDLEVREFLKSRTGVQERHTSLASPLAPRRIGPPSRQSTGASPPPHRPSNPRDTSLPLPHDGLFIRRNNAFGTRSLLGVRDLIEQGVVIGQDQIRFDDFVAARTDQVPGPRRNEGIAVSHGLAAVQGEFKANKATTHFLEITLKAGGGHPDDAPATEPLAVNFVFAVDTSGSMQGEKLDTVKASLQTLYDKLRPTDCLGIITFDHGVRTVLPAVARQDLPPERFAQVVSELTAGGGTDINLGVQYGIDELGRHSARGRTVDCLYLFSDGDPTSGERDWITIRRNIAARIRGDLTLSCFGFGTDARMPELAALAGLAGGHSTFVTRPDQVAEDLLGDLSRRDHLAAVNIQLRLDVDPGVEVRHLYGHDLVTDPRARSAVLREARHAAVRAREDYGTEALPDIITEEKGIRIFAPDLAFDETYWIVLELAVPPGRELPDLGTATVQYVDTVARDSRSHHLDLAKEFTLSEETVTVHGLGLWTSEVTFYALDDLYHHDRDSATKRLTQHIKTLRDAYHRLPAVEFRDDQVTLQKLITLAGTLGTMQSFSDGSHVPGAPTAVKAMNAFGQVRSGHWQLH
ncbi:VWA domain-containing protein [Streptomyces xylophagus]|uniref:VWA domain-containing protein n=1 Tax=Streptomyces xylophagus TaxID=285514 RepID=UPI0005BCE12C|nr:VWA domain-containing protein [Streptomyces xylophagus]